MVRYRAVMVDIWKFIDPSIPRDELLKPTKAALPLPIDVNPDKILISFSELDAEEREELKMRRTTYTNCKKMNLPDVADTRSVYDFLDAVHDITLTGVLGILESSDSGLGP
ncbi:MAG: hypothetical protein M1840_007847 [Geoglossum simile]|nr:MAG: hypothetical protein M1840_007847 [Geoglossum simile]